MSTPEPAPPSSRRPSEKQIAANRANAKKSTGPRTSEGKARSSLNALTHGLTAKRTVLPNEDRREFEAFARGLRKDLRPDGPVQVLLVERVIDAAWKLRRAEAIQCDVVRHAIALYSNSEAVTPGRLLADAVCGEPRAQSFWNIDRYAEQLQRSFFTALNRLHREKRLAERFASEPNSGVTEDVTDFGLN